MMIHVLDTALQVRGSALKIARLDGEKFLFAADPDRIVDALRRSRHHVDIFTFIQKAADTSPKHSYPMEWDNLAVLPITTFEHWWNHQIGKKTRNMARQVDKKNVSIREVPFSADLLQGIWQIYNETPIRQGRKFPHFGKSLETVYQEEATYLDRSIFIGAFLDEKLIGFVKLLWDFDYVQAGLLNIVSLIEQRDKAPTNGLVAHAVRICAERKTSFLLYSNFAYGKRDHDSLSDFKERNGFQRVDLPRYYVPLSPVGNVALKLGLHKKISERIPEGIILKLRDFRKSWYERRPSAAAENV
jgi:hypothetical protein